MEAARSHYPSQRTHDQNHIAGSISTQSHTVPEQFSRRAERFFQEAKRAAIFFAAIGCYALIWFYLNQ